MNYYPLKLSYIEKSMLWGGSNLKKLMNKHSNFDKLAETWELSVRENEMCRITNGEYAGLPLGDYIKKFGKTVVSDTYNGEKFPLLIKFIDAADKLSIQVHPTDKYAKEVEHDSGKTEMWYIISAEKDAEIIYGMADGIDHLNFADFVRSGKIDETLRHIKVTAGETYFIPSGMLHAIGQGIVIAEIQQNSDLTYRVYDYNRRDFAGNLRPLHVEKAIAVCDTYTNEYISNQQFEYASDKSDSSLLCACKYFTTQKLTAPYSAIADKSSFHSLICIDGKGTIICNSAEYPCEVGDSYYIPADCGEYNLDGEFTVIKTTLTKK